MKKNLKYILFIIGLAVIVMMVMEFANRATEGQRLKIKKTQVEGQVTELAVTRLHLQTQVAYAASDAAALQYAYEEQRLIRPGDVRVVPVPQPNLTSLPTPIPSAPGKDFSNWEYWWALFVDSES